MSNGSSENRSCTQSKYKTKQNHKMIKHGKKICNPGKSASTAKTRKHTHTQSKDKPLTRQCACAKAERTNQERQRPVEHTTKIGTTKLLLHVPLPAPKSNDYQGLLHWNGLSLISALIYSIYQDTNVTIVKKVGRGVRVLLLSLYKLRSTQSNVE